METAGRIAAAVLGGYAFTWGFAALGMASLFAAGMPFEDAEALCGMLAFLVFLCAFLWAFAARRLGLVWLVLAGGALLMSGAAFLLQRALL